MNQTVNVPKKTPVKTRFAPSPTGFMHFGNLRVALFNYLLAHKEGGTFLLRIEDTDVARSEHHYREAILQDLKWMGLQWNEGPYYQSERQAIYDEYYQKLSQLNLIYPCFCSEESLMIARKVQLSRGQPPRYAGTCSHLDPDTIQAKKKEGIPFTLRFRVPQSMVVFEDLIKGTQKFDSQHIGDFIIRRGDGSASFMFCNAIDDALLGITHALRGDDHLTNTPRQILILQALNLPIPQYGHFPTILGPDSRPLSKRNGSRSLRELQEEGYLPLGISNYLSRLGHSDPEPKYCDLESLAQQFDLKRISLAPAHFDEQQLNHWQKEAMHQVPFAEAWKLMAPFVQDRVPEDKQKEFVMLIQPNIVMPVESKIFAEALFDEILNYPEELKLIIKETGPDFFIMAAELLKNTEIASNFEIFLKTLQEKMGKKGKALFLPCRAALTAMPHGPELPKILALMGIDRARHRFLEAAHYATNL